MRGRTNAGGSGTLAIKGNVQQFTVEEGKTVTGGDFVEYSTQKNENVLSYMDFGGGKTIQLEENLVITQDDEAIYLLKMVNEKLTIVGSYDEKRVGGYCVMDNGNIAVAVKEEPYLIILKVANSLFQLACSAEAISEVIDTKHGIFVERFGEKLCLMYCKLTGGGSSGSSYRTFNIAYNLLEIQGDKLVFSEWKEVNDIFQFYADYITDEDVFVFKRVFGVGDYIYYCIRYRTHSNSSYPAADYIRRVEIDVGRNELLNNSATFKGDVNISPVVFFDKYILTSEDDSFYIINSSAGTSVKIPYNSFGFTKETGSATSTTGAFAFAKYGEDKLAMFYYASYYAKERYQVAVFQVNEYSGDIARLSEIFQPEFSKNFFNYTRIGAFFLNGIVNVTSYVDNATYCYAMSYDKNSHQLTDTIDADYVKTYEGGTTMGVAKQSGTGGQKIDVFVPKL